MSCYSHRLRPANQHCCHCKSRHNYQTLGFGLRIHRHASLASEGLAARVQVGVMGAGSRMGMRQRRAEVGRVPRASSASMRYSLGWCPELNEETSESKIAPSAMAQVMICESQYGEVGEVTSRAACDCDGARGCLIPRSPVMTLTAKCWRARNPRPFPPAPLRQGFHPAGYLGISRVVLLRPWCARGGNEA